MEKKILAVAVIAALQFTALNALARDTSKPVEPNGNTLESVDAKEEMAVPKTELKLNENNRIAYMFKLSPSAFAERARQFSEESEAKAGCESVFTAYHRFFETMFPSPPSLLNECALGRLIDMRLIQGFDPIGSLLKAIRGAMCGFIKDLHDPFVNSINSKMNKANQWVDSTNQSYSDWIDETSRDLQKELYNPKKDFKGDQYKFGKKELEQAEKEKQAQTNTQPQTQPETPNTPAGVITAPTETVNTIKDSKGNSVEYYDYNNNANEWQTIYDTFRLDSN